MHGLFPCLSGVVRHGLCGGHPLFCAGFIRYFVHMHPVSVCRYRILCQAKALKQDITFICPQKPHNRFSFWGYDYKGLYAIVQLRGSQVAKRAWWHRGVVAVVVAVRRRCTHTSAGFSPRCCSSALKPHPCSPSHTRARA